VVRDMTMAPVSVLAGHLSDRDDRRSIAYDGGEFETGWLDD
jgi:hypothetical protein